jgi:hypothetical protein
MNFVSPQAITVNFAQSGFWRAALSYRLFLLLASVLLSLQLGSIAAYGQSDDQDIAPPPLKFVSKEDLTQLNAMPDVKKRTKLAIELMTGSLKQAETLHAGEQYDDMFKQLGRFHGLMDNTLAFLDDSEKDRGKVLNNYKRFEIGLREYRPRLELIRRDLPLRYELYVRNLIIYLRDARTKAVEPMFSDTVLPRSKP